MPCLRWVMSNLSSLSTHVPFLSLLDVLLGDDSIRSAPLPKFCVVGCLVCWTRKSYLSCKYPSAIFVGFTRTDIPIPSRQSLGEISFPNFLAEQRLKCLNYLAILAYFRLIHGVSKESSQIFGFRGFVQILTPRKLVLEPVRAAAPVDVALHLKKKDCSCNVFMTLYGTVPVEFTRARMHEYFLWEGEEMKFAIKFPSNLKRDFYNSLIESLMNFINNHRRMTYAPPAYARSERILLGVEIYIPYGE